MKISSYLTLLRPTTLMAPIVGAVAFGYLAMHSAGFDFNSVWWLILVSTFTLATCNAASNVINQCADLPIDKISKPNRPLPRDDIKPWNALSFGVILYGFALVLGFLINTTYGLLVAVILFCTWVYSYPPRLKKYLFLNNLAISTPRGMLGIMAAYSLFGDPFEIHILAFGLIISMYVFGANITKDFQDHLADKKYGIRNFVTVYGKKTAAEITTLFLFIPFLLVIAFVRLGLLIPEMIFLTFLIPLSIIISLSLRQHPKGSWILFYIQLSLLMVGFVWLMTF